MRYAKLTSILFAVAGLVSSAACTETEDLSDELAITCEGKCDGLSSVRALIADAKLLDLQDLINLGAGLATDQLNDALDAGNYGAIRIQPTELYAPADVAAQDLTLKNLDTLISGLATRFGESALTTEVNEMRREHLRNTGKRVYAESSFFIRANLGPSWSHGTAGFGRDATSTAHIGFDAGGDIEARTITVHDRENAGLINAPLTAIKSTRGFVIPRSTDDIKRMEQGESLALAGRGRLGINLGAGVPILVADPTSYLTYSLVLSAGMRSLFEGDLDVQLVKGRQDQVIVDVGVRRATLKEKFVALEDGWGVSGLVQSNFEIAGQSVDLGRLVDKAVQSKINDKLDLISARASATNTTMRMSVARLRFSLDAADPTGARDEALAQALKGDVRLAQALAARGDAGVIAEFDMVRSGASAISYAGIDVLGMSFYRRTAESEGSSVIQTPGGILALMWDSLHKENGWFFSSHGYTRIGVAGLRFDAATPGVAKSETNLFLQTVEGDDFMERDKVIDQIDSAIVAVGGMNALRAIEEKGNALERYVLAECPVPQQGFSEQCNINLLNDGSLTAQREAALADFDAAIASLPAASRDMLHTLGDLRLKAQSIEDARASLVGPTASVVFDFRLDDAALRSVFSKDQTQFKQAVLNLMIATQLDRTDANADRARITQRSDATAGEMAQIFIDHKSQYERLVSIDGARITGLGEIGGNAIEIRYPVDSRNRPKYEEAISQSVAQARSRVVASLFDKLRSEAKDMPSSGGSSAAHAEQIASFTLLSLAPADRTEVRFELKTDNSSCALCGSQRRYNVAGFVNTDVYAKGDKVSTIAAGLFDIDAVIDAPR